MSASSYIGLVYGSISLVAALLICIGLERLPRPNGHKHKTPTPTTHTLVSRIFVAVEYSVVLK